MDKSMERLVEMLNYKEDPLYARVLSPILKDVTIDTLDKVLIKQDEVVKGLFDKSNAPRLFYPSFGKLVAKGLIEKANGGMKTLEPFVVEGGMDSPTVSLGTEPIHFGKGVAVTRSVFDAQTYLDNGSIIQYSKFPMTSGTSFVGPKSIVSEAIIRNCLISGNENGKEKGTYVHPLMLADTIVGYGAQISYGTVSFTHPLHDGSAPFIDPIDCSEFDTGRRKGNPSFVGAQRKIGDEVRRTKVGSNVVLNNPCVVGSGYAIENGTNFYGIAWLQEEGLDALKKPRVVKNCIKPEHGLDPMPF